MDFNKLYIFFLLINIMTSNSFMENIKEISQKIKIEKIKKEEENIFQGKMNTYTIYDKIMKKLTKELYVSISTQIKQYTEKGFDNIIINYDMNLIKRYLNEIKFDKSNIKISHIFEKIVHDHDITNDPNKLDFDFLNKDLQGPLKSFLLDMICASKNEGEKFKKILAEWFKHMSYEQSNYLKINNYPHLKGLGFNIINIFEETKLEVNLVW